jgi:chromosomal replication initiator protein
MAHEVNQSERDVAALVRSALVSRISSERLELWIPQDTAWDFQQGVLTLAFQTDFACQICRKMLRHEISGALSEVVGAGSQELHFIVRTSSTMSPSKSECTQPAVQQFSDKPNSDSTCPAALRSDNPPQAVEQDQAAKSKSSTVVSRGDVSNDKPQASISSVWSNFIAGDSNQLAWTSINLVAAEPGRMTPVLIHGPTGTGKSLMLSALAQRMRSEMRMRRVVHLTSEQFTNDFTEGLRGGGLPMFRRKYRDVDALLLDDVHFLIGKKSTLAEVRHTVDNLLRAGKQVVVTADRPPAELSGLGDELLGRLRGGLTTPLFPLDDKIRFNLLKQLISSAQIDVDEEILHQLAKRIAGDGRLIRGVVHRLTAVGFMKRGKLAWEQCWSAVMDLVQATHPVVRMADIERVVCGIFGLEADSLQSKSKMRSVSQPRMLAMFLARKYTPAAYKEIGDYFGQRRHSTVISAEKTVSAWLSEDAPLDGTRLFSVRDAIRHVEAQLQVG